MRLRLFLVIWLGRRSERLFRVEILVLRVVVFVVGIRESCFFRNLECAV